MSVFITNVDDFIAPSQACINPFVLTRNKEPEVESKAPANLGGSKVVSRIVLETDFSTTDFEAKVHADLLRSKTVISAVKPDLIKSKISSNNQKVAAVSLNDCLACR